MSVVPYVLPNMNKPVGVYKRPGSDIWWYRVGRGIRRSSGSRNVEDAILIRSRVVASENKRMIETDWKREVESQAESAQGWLRRAHASIQKRSRLNGWDTYLTLDELSTLLLQSGGKCALTGLPMIINAKKRDPFSISIDRIDSHLGYVYGNVRLVALAVNLAMSHWGEEALLTIAKALVGRCLINESHSTLYMDKTTDIDGIA